MKRIVAFILLSTGVVGSSLFAQNWNFPTTPGIKKTDLLFKQPFLYRLPHRFQIGLNNGNSINIEVLDKIILEKLNLDSLLTTVTNNIELLGDSLQNELTIKRLDYMINNNQPPKIRLQEYGLTARTYTVMNDGIAAMKIEQDTINIVVSRPDLRKMPARSWGYYNPIAYRITFLINDLNDLKKYTSTSFNDIIRQISNEWNANTKWSVKSNNFKINLYSYYNVTDTTKNIHIKNTAGKQYSRTNFFPYAQIAIQPISGNLATSGGLGVEWVKVFYYGRAHYQIMWEPYFFFDKRTDGKFKMHRNDFITFQQTFSVVRTTGKENIGLNQSWSLSFLAHKSGSYFEKNTFKFGLPGFQYRSIFLGPEFLFNNFFKNFQPSIKLRVSLD